jgi:hypothetical protein
MSCCCCLIGGSDNGYNGNKQCIVDIHASFNTMKSLPFMESRQLFEATSSRLIQLHPYSDLPAPLPSNTITAKPTVEGFDFGIKTLTWPKSHSCGDRDASFHVPCTLFCRKVVSNSSRSTRAIAPVCEMKTRVMAKKLRMCMINRNVS